MQHYRLDRNQKIIEGRFIGGFFNLEIDDDFYLHVMNKQHEILCISHYRDLSRRHLGRLHSSMSYVDALCRDVMKGADTNRGCFTEAPHIAREFLGSKPFNNPAYRDAFFNPPF